MDKILKNKGITLIALIVTIIVLLILAGVGIAMLTGENGILGKATIAKEKTKEAEDEENKRLEDYSSMIDQYYTRSGNQDPENPSDEVTALKNRIQELESSNTYSTTGEVRIGKWINNKPIYRKVIQLTTGNTAAWNKKEHNVNDIEEFTNIYGHLKNSAGWTVSGGSTGANNIMVDANNKEVELYCNASNTFNAPAIVIIEYTKTTDKAS